MADINKILILLYKNQYFSKHWVIFGKSTNFQNYIINKICVSGIWSIMIVTPSPSLLENIRIFYFVLLKIISYIFIYS